MVFIYQLYHNKEYKEIKIQKLQKGLLEFKDKTIVEPYEYNDYYYLCSDRQKLKELAEKIKNAWIRDIKEILSEYENIKIITKR